MGHGEPALRVLSYNIREGGGARLPALAAILRAHRPAAVALLEANSHANATALARDLEMYFAFGEANSAYHIAWLSRPPIRRATNHRLAALAKTLLAIEVDWAGAPLHLCATHLASRHDATRPAAEIAAILDVLRPLANQPHLLVGDFNALAPGDPVGEPPPGVIKRGEAVAGTPRPNIGALLAAGYVDCFRLVHPHTPGYTYPAATPWLRLDYAFASPTLARRLHACEIIATTDTATASDHLPLLVEFR